MTKFKHRFQINPIGVNQMNDHFKSKGRPTPSMAYREYQNEIRDELMGTEWPFEDKFVGVRAEFGISHRAKDLDNLAKPLLDTLQRIYDEFNDNRVYLLHMEKIKVEKGSEYIDLEIVLLEPKDNNKWGIYEETD